VPIRRQPKSHRSDLNRRPPAYNTKPDGQLRRETGGYGLLLGHPLYGSEPQVIGHPKCDEMQPVREVA
jgi:hypothetical protein